MRLSASWLMLVCLSIAGCSDDEKGQSEGAVVSSDASVDEAKESDKSSKDTKKSASTEKTGTGKQASAGAGGSKSDSSSASGDKGASPDSSDDAKKSEDSKKDSKDENKPSDGDKGNESDKEGDKPAGSDAPAGSDSDKPQNSDTTSPGSGPATTGDQLAVCARTEGDCNQGLACHAPAGPFSAGRGYCSKICQKDEDCSGLAPEGTKYTCSDGPGTSTCEVACSGADDKSCPASMVCVQTGVRRRPAAAADGGTPEGAGNGDAGTARASAFEQVFGCRHAFETSKIWGQCGDASHVCGEGLRCAAAFWFGGAGHCTRSCESDADCEKPESGSAKPTCMTLVPAFGDTPAVKQCVLSCSEAKDGCPNGLACFEGPETRSSEGSEPMPAFAWCQ